MQLRLLLQRGLPARGCGRARGRMQVDIRETEGGGWTIQRHKQVRPQTPSEDQVNWQGGKKLWPCARIAGVTSIFRLGGPLWRHPWKRQHQVTFVNSCAFRRTVLRQIFVQMIFVASVLKAIYFMFKGHFPYICTKLHKCRIQWANRNVLTSNFYYYN